MKILKLVLSGYRRLMLNNIHHLELTPNSTYQLILGTNGCGKSSVLYELSPLPAIANNYIKGGFKTIELKHKDSNYVLHSNFKNGNRHSFLCNGEELNQGGTLTVQKELVVQHFNITVEIHELLIGEAHFTNLSPTRRREWMTRLCDVDFSYAIGVYQKLKTSLRDTQGALKHVKNRIVNESNKLLLIGDLEDQEAVYLNLHAELDKLFRERDNQIQPIFSLNSKIDRGLADIESLAKLLIEKTPKLPLGADYTSIEDINAALINQQVFLEVKETLRQRIGQEYQELVQLIQQFKDAGISELDSVRQQCDNLIQERDGYRVKIERWQEIVGNPITLLPTFYNVSGDLITLLQNFILNEERQYTPQTLSQEQEQLRSNNQQHNLLQNKIAHIESQLERFEALVAQNCPACGHQWIPGRTEADIKLLEQQKVGLLQQLHELEVTLQKNRDFIEQAHLSVQQFYTLKQLSREYPTLKQLWETILLSKELNTNPVALISLVYSYGRDLEVHSNIYKLEERIARLEKLFESTENESQLGSLNQRLESLALQIEELTVILTHGREKYTQLTRYHKHVKVYLEKITTLKDLLDHLIEDKDQLIKAQRALELETVIKAHQNKLAVLQSQRTEKHTLEGIIANLKQDELRLALDQAALEVLTENLSPSDGLIAEQLTGFIDSFVAHINQIIQSIWTYELRVLPCGLESGELDYRFPLLVKHEGRDNITPDIVKGSEAQVEVVNLAFRLVTMVYLGLHEYPLYLDEVGRSFDEQHRINVMNFLKRLVDTGNYPQMFLVSHYAAQYNIFPNPEVLVLDGTNILIPSTHNTHAVME
jgi:hypothetical protein